MEWFNKLTASCGHSFVYSFLILSTFSACELSSVDGEGGIVINDPPPGDEIVKKTPYTGDNAGLLITKAQLERAKQRLSDSSSPFHASCTGLLSRSQNTPTLFKMSNPVQDMKFSWCGDSDGVDNSLKDFVSAVTNDFSNAASAANSWLLRGDKAAAERAIHVFELWDTEATIVNLYDFNINFAAGTIEGQTSDGYCGVRPWNFALDMGWTTYGLRLASEAYLILDLNGYPMTDAQRLSMKSVIRKLASTTDSSLDAWSEWANYHRNASSHNRYVSDNHIAEYLSGLSAAAAALGGAEGKSLFEYVVNGTAHDFGGGNNKAQYVPLKKYLDEALVLEPGTNNVVFEDYYWKTNYRTYHAHVQLALGTLFRGLDLHFPKEEGLYENYINPSGYSSMMAATTLAKFINGDINGGADDNRNGFYTVQVGLEYARNSSSDLSLIDFYEQVLDLQLTPSNVPRTQYFKEFDTSTCYQAEEY